ncbi:MAG: prolipoprotein diacylglyceryl transferase [Bacteroidetes bacterium]|nr:prolipoprotein diacylglyceryl transferase [Bacteroidota bacterium]
MIPVLFELGPFRVYSYGLMLGIAFLLGSVVLARELKRRGLDGAMANTITVLAVVFGIAGAKILYLIEEWDSFLMNPVGMTFSAGGLTWYGGFLLALFVVSMYIRKKKVSFLKVWDCLGIALILTYGVGRIGCHLSGDGDYGIPTTLTWGTIYAQGTAKPSVMLEAYFNREPSERESWHYDSLRVIIAGKDKLGHLYTRFDEVTPLHPAPIYELLLGILGYFLLLAIQRRQLPDGALFMMYLMLASTFRFAIEFLRLNPRIAGGLTEAQLFSIALFALGFAGFIYLGRQSEARTTGAG